MDQSRYVQQFEQAIEQSIDGRKEAETARNYFDGNQWTAAEKAALKKRKQPIVWENLIRPKIEALCGLERQGRVDPVAYPRTPNKEQAANAATDALRYAEQDQDLDIKKSRVFENMLIEGEGAVEVTVRKVGDAIDPYVVRIAYDRLYGDPYSSEADRSDASFVGYITWMDFERAKLKWPEKVDVLEATQNRGHSSSFDTMDDKPKWATWYDAKRKRILINTHYHLEGGVWHRCVFTLAGELEESAPSVFLDDEGRPENPLIMQAAYVDQDNDRYGIIRDMIPIQDDANKRMSKFLHMVNSSKIRVSPTVGKDKELIRKEYARPDAVMIGEAGEIEEIGNLAKESGQFEIYQARIASLKGNIGPNAYMQGKQGQDQSGRAILAQQQAGMTEMTPLLDNLRHFTLRMYRQIWNRIRQYWTAERWIRVTDDENNVRFVGLNTPPEIGPEQAQEAAMQIQMHVQQGALDPQAAQQYMAAVREKMQPGNVLADCDVDIDIDEVNETPTIQAEQFQDLMQLVGTGVFGTPVPPEVAELIIAASQFRDKQKLIDIVEKMRAQAQQPNPMQQLQQAGAQAEVENTQADTELKRAKAREAGAPRAPEQDKPIGPVEQSQAVLNMAKARKETAGPTPLEQSQALLNVAKAHREVTQPITAPQRPQ